MSQGDAFCWALIVYAGGALAFVLAGGGLKDSVRRPYFWLSVLLALFLVYFGWRGLHYDGRPLESGGSDRCSEPSRCGREAAPTKQNAHQPEPVGAWERTGFSDWRYQPTP